MKLKQIKLFHEAPIKKYYGGKSLIGKRKAQRPLSTKMPIHLILKSNHKSAYKVFSFHNKLNYRFLKKIAEKHHIKIYRRVFNHTHLHLVIKIPHRKCYVAFIREFTASLSKQAGLSSGQLFQYRPFTRILSWGREFKIIQNYMNKNWVEAIGCIDISPREIPNTC